MNRKMQLAMVALAGIGIALMFVRNGTQPKFSDTNLVPPTTGKNWVLEDHVGTGVMSVGENELTCGSRKSSGADWNVMCRTSIPIQQGRRYQLQYCAEAEAPRHVTVTIRNGMDPWNSYGLHQELQFLPGHHCRTDFFVASETDMNAQLMFGVGLNEGTTKFSYVYAYAEAEDE